MPKATKWIFARHHRMTSNIGADLIKKQSSLGFALKRDENAEERLSYEDMRKKLQDSLKRALGLSSSTAWTRWSFSAR